MKKLFTSVLALLAAVCLYATDLNIYASGLHATQSAGVTTIDYMLNADATSLKVKFYQGTTFVDEIAITGVSDRTRGAHSVTLDLSSLPVGTYNWAIEASAAAHDTIGVGAPDSIVYKVYGPRGVAVDNSLESPYFGRVYVANACGGTTSRFSRATQQGMYIFDAALHHLNNTAYTGNVKWTTNAETTATANSDWGPYRLAIDEDGYVFIVDNGVSNTTTAHNGKKTNVYMMDPANPAGNFVMVLDSALRGDLGGLYYRVNSVAITGRGANRVMYINDWTDSIVSYPIGNTFPCSTKGTAVVPKASFTAAGVANGQNTIARDKDGGFWVCQFRGQLDATPELVHFNAAGTHDYSISSTSHKDLGLTDTYRGAMALSPSGDKLIMGGAGSFKVYNVGVDGGGAPILTALNLTYPTGLGSKVDGVAFDVADNVYVVSAATERMFVFSLPKANNTFETPAPSASTITWDGNIVHVTSVALNETSASIVKGQTLQLTATITPNDATNQNVSWESLSDAIATVSDAGLVTAVAPGEADIVVTTEDGSKTATCHVTVTYTAVTGVELNKTELALFTGYKEVLVATVSPNDATEPELTWESSDPTIATVSSTGEVMAVAPGTATITATSISNNEKSATCEVTISGYSVTFNTFYAERTFAELSGKTIRRAIAREGMLYVLALDGNEPYLYRINTMTYEVTTLPTDFCSVEIADGLKLSDIALTSDGVLIGCNKEHCTNSKARNFNVYKWEENDGVYNGAIWFSVAETQTAGNFYDAFTGESMVYVGSSVSGKLVTTARTLGAETGAIRLYICNVNDSEFASNTYNRTAAPLRKAELGADFQLNVMPDGETFVLDGGKYKPCKFQLIGNESESISSSILLSSANTLAFSNFFEYDGRSLALTTHFDETNNDGFVINEVINGVAPDVIDNVDALSAEAATFAAAVGESWNNNAYVYMLRNNKLSVYTTGMIPDHLYEFGSNNNWNKAASEEMTKIGNNIFEGTYEYTSGDFYFAFATVQSDNWSEVNSHRFSGPSADYSLTELVPASLTYGVDQSIKLPAGRYKMTVDLNKNTIVAKRIYAEALYLVGGVQNWDPANTVELPKVEDNVFEETFQFEEANNHFAFTTSHGGNWSDVNAARYICLQNQQLVKDGEVLTIQRAVDDAGNATITILPGTYTFRVDMRAMTLTVTQLAAQIAVSEVGYATYYNSVHAYEMPTGMEGYVFNAVDELVLEYEAGEVVPAGVGLVLKAAESIYPLVFAEGGVAPMATNQLLGTDEETALEDDGVSNYYALSLAAAPNDTPESVGFYWMVEDNGRGAAFTNGAHKAYLKLGASQAPQRFYLFHGENNTTDIQAIEASEKAVKFIENGQLYILRDGVIYDATGRRVR